MPVVKIHKARSNDTIKVDVEFTPVPAKITTGQVSLALFQDRPAVDKVLPRTLRIGLYSKDDTILSEIKTYTFDSQSDEARHRETVALLTLSRSPTRSTGKMSIFVLRKRFLARTKWCLTNRIN